MRKIYILIVLLSTLNVVDAQQFNIAGTAVQQSASCFRLTDTSMQAGAIWNLNTINLTQPFEIILTLNFGKRLGNFGYDPVTCGGDGMSFILQPLSSGVLGVGSGIGFHGITPSVGVIMDTYNYNSTDPSYNHISINKNGDELHFTTNELTSYNTAVNFPAILADSLDHLLRIKWTPGLSGSGTLQVYFGTATTLPTTPTISYTGDIVNTIFSGNPNVYWGISGSTGGCWNKQTACFSNMANFVTSASTCLGQAIVFTDNSISGSTITNWKWNFGDGDTSILQNPTHTFANQGTYNVTHSIVNSAGLTTTITHPVVVHPKPIVIVNNPSICKGDTATLTATGALSYTWSNSSSIDSTIKVTPFVNSSYIVTGIDAFGCINKDTAFVTVHPIPVITATSATICQGDTASLLATGGVTYFWKPVGSTTNPLKVNPSINTVYTVIGSSIYGCKDSAYANVNIYTTPAIMFTVDQTSGCEPLVVQFTNATDPPNNTYIWDFGDGQTSTLENPTHTYNAGLYSINIKATSSFGCVESNDIPNLINAYQRPVAEFTWSPTIGATNIPVVFTNSTLPINNTFTYEWNFGDGSTIDYNANTVHIYTVNDTYNVKLISFSDFNCRDTVIHSISIITGIDEVSKENTFSIYPNPVEDQFTIEYYATESIKLILTNELGKELETIVLNDNSGSKQIYVFDMSAYSKGIYFIKLQRKESSISRKIVKAK